MRRENRAWDDMNGDDDVDTQGTGDRVEGDDAEPWADALLVVEGLEQASCSAHAKTMAIETIAIFERGGTAEDWREVTAARHADHPRWQQHLEEAERCMRAAGLWPWTRVEGQASPGGLPPE